VGFLNLLTFSFYDIYKDDSHGELVKTVLIPQFQVLHHNSKLQAALDQCFSFNISSISEVDEILGAIKTK
jgi:hypothetical protein